MFLNASIDATSPDGSLGRLVNHDKVGNCTMKKIIVDGQPELCLFATENIPKYTELKYNYGVKNLPWETKVVLSVTFSKPTCREHSIVY